MSDPDEIKQLTSAGLRIGEGALSGKGRMVSADAAERKDAAQSRAEHIRKVVPLGVRNFCLTISPTNPQEPDRSATFKFAVDSYGQLCSLIEDTGAHIVLEPYPGKQPRYANLGCTPESLRSLFKEIGSDVMGVNLDPSHLIWTGIDTVRFVHEFADRIHHIHAKDTQILDNNLYDCGNLQDHTYRPMRTTEGAAGGTRCPATAWRAGKSISRYWKNVATRASFPSSMRTGVSTAATS